MQRSTGFFFLTGFEYGRRINYKRWGMGCDSNSAETQDRRKQSNYDFTSFPAVQVLGCFDQHLHQSDRRHFQQ